MIYIWYSGSQENLDELDKADTAVRTKAPELIGHLCCVLWIYNEAFRCIHSEEPFQISRLIPAHYVKSAEECVQTSYGHSETFTSVCFT